MNQPTISPKEEYAARPEDRATPTSGLVPFALRATIVAIVIAGTISALLPEVPDFRPRIESIKRALREESVRVRLTGLLTNNPAVHWRMSQIEEGKGNLATAIIEIELAIGLLELHSANKSVVDRYSNRLKELQAKSAANKPVMGDRIP
jgi:hypothetical protein